MVDDLIIANTNTVPVTAQKMKFSIKDFFIFCAVCNDYYVSMGYSR